MYIWQESHYEKKKKNKKDLYRVSFTFRENGILMGEGAEFLEPLAPAVKEAIPAVKATVRMSYFGTFSTLYGQKLSQIDNIYLADSAFFDLFTFSLLEGDPSTVLSNSFSIVLTDKIAENIFGDENPVGKNILLNGTDNYTVTGIVETPPVNSQFEFNALISFSTVYQMPDLFLGWHGGNRYTTYLQLYDGADTKNVTEKLNEIVWENIGRQYSEDGFDMKGSLQPLRDVHLYFDSDSDMLRFNLTVFSIVALLILVIAVINFVNLTTARSLKRVKEAGVRKILGAKRRNLIMQFLAESECIALMAFVLTLGAVKLSEPLYIQLSGNAFPFNDAGVGIIGGLFVLTIVIGLIGGSIPAVRLSSISLEDASKGGGAQKRNKNRIQNILIIFQLAISAGLIVCTLVVSRQLSFINHKETGIDRNRIIVLSLTEDSAIKNIPVLKQRLQAFPEVIAVAASSDIPIDDFTKNGYFPEGMQNPMMIHVVEMDEDFPTVYGIQLKTGRFPSDDSQADKTAILINETLAKKLEWDDNAIGKHIRRVENHEIAGIVKDFNFASLYKEIQPLILSSKNEDDFYKISIKYVGDDVSVLLKKIKTAWDDVNPNTLFEYSFFDELYDNLYKTEQHFRLLFLIFALIAIVLASSGMLTLMIYTTEQRKKEIGIRKIVGASVKEILQMLLRHTMIQLLIANMIALPIAWWFIHKWLENFAYRISIGWTIFVFALLISTAIALSAVGFKALRAAMADPIKSISNCE
jgi:putative ABC transport system permease protein